MSTPATDRPAPGEQFRSLSNFYLGDRRRISSRERDIGLWWREGDGPLHRAAWVSETGELYLVRLGPPDEGGGEVELLAIVEDEELLERELDGWRDVCAQPDSLRWLRERATALEHTSEAAATPSGRIRPARRGPRRYRAPNARLLPLITGVLALLAPASALLFDLESI